MVKSSTSPLKSIVLNTSMQEDMMEPSIASEFNYDIHAYFADKKAKLIAQYSML